ncbi:uncharacterized protein V1516DRAFT_675747 [Lipomyces oligophaga]|uniref:uncharacterized protein n=1 Tax=Lipomyces oligophaga TaxID=45792 RepID=UPI0034CEE839
MRAGEDSDGCVRPGRKRAVEDIDHTKGGRQTASSLHMKIRTGPVDIKDWISRSLSLLLWTSSLPHTPSSQRQLVLRHLYLVPTLDPILPFYSTLPTPPSRHTLTFIGTQMPPTTTRRLCKIWREFPDRLTSDERDRVLRYHEAEARRQRDRRRKKKSTEDGDGDVPDDTSPSLSVIEHDFESRLVSSTPATPSICSSTLSSPADSVEMDFEEELQHPGTVRHQDHLWVAQKWEEFDPSLYFPLCSTEPTSMASSLANSASSSWSTDLESTFDSDPSYELESINTISPGDEESWQPLLVPADDHYLPSSSSSSSQFLPTMSTNQSSNASSAELYEPFIFDPDPSCSSPYPNSNSSAASLSSASSYFVPQYPSLDMYAAYDYQSF